MLTRRKFDICLLLTMFCSQGEEERWRARGLCNYFSTWSWRRRRRRRRRNICGTSNLPFTSHFNNNIILSAVKSFLKTNLFCIIFIFTETGEGFLNREVDGRNGYGQREGDVTPLELCCKIANSIFSQLATQERIDKRRKLVGIAGIEAEVDLTRWKIQLYKMMT